MISAIQRLENGNIKLTITIPKAKIEQAYKEALASIAGETTIDGFRPGKAPLEKIEQKIGKDRIVDKSLKSLIPDIYIEAIKEHKIVPIVSPKVTLISAEEGKDWQITAETCELPKVILGKYKEEIKSANTAGSIWTPGKDEKTDKDNPRETEARKLDEIFKALIKSAQVKLPEILVEDDLNRNLSKIIEQTNKLGMTIDQYLSSINKTTDQLREEQRQQVEETLKLELILATIADERKIEIGEDDLKKFLDAIPAKEKENIDLESQKAYIKSILRKRQVIDYLLKL